jgi:hypothetical protein
MAALSTVEVVASAGSAREIALAPATTVIKSRRFSRFMWTPSLGFEVFETSLFRTLEQEFFSPPAEKIPIYLRRRNSYLTTFNNF